MRPGPLLGFGRGFDWEGDASMDQERARTLLEEERRRLEQLQASIAADQDRVTADTKVAEDLVDGATRRVEEETDEAIARQLDHRLRALQRAEARLAAGSYGRSVLSGRAIPDERLEAFPLAELTERPFVEAVERAAVGQDGEDGVGRGPARLDAARLGPSREPFQVLRDPAVQDNQLLEDDETTYDEPPPELDPAMPELPDGVAEDDTGRIQSLPEHDQR